MANILYLENHAVFAEQVTRKFLSNHKVTVVPSLTAARRALDTTSFDLIFSDYDLDDGKGDEFVRECRIKHPDLHVVAVSSHDAGNSALLQAGATVVCGKMEFDQIERVIEPFLHEK
jgi:DNA-binding NarL/FixJ family response regulator